MSATTSQNTQKVDLFFNQIHSIGNAYSLDKFVKFLCYVHLFKLFATKMAADTHRCGPESQGGKYCLI